MPPIPVLIWLFAPIMGVLGACAPLYISDKPLDAWISYKDVIQGLYLVALSTYALAAAEAVELAFWIERSQFNNKRSRTIVACVVVNLVLLVLVTLALAKYTVRSDVAGFAPDIRHLMQSGGLLCTAIVVGLYLKWSLEDVKL
jgi:uncharacterized membrane protein